MEIAEVELRGLLLPQLYALLLFLRSQCVRGGEGVRLPGRHTVAWSDVEGPEDDVLEGWHCGFSGQRLRFSAINLYQLTEWVIKPLTRAADRSYVEEVTTEPSAQKPSWFVSHWWGEPVFAFVRLLEKHLETRQLEAEATAYWICAYANRQHDVGGELGRDPMQSSFLKAMALSEGVVLVLDTVGPATPFSRIWCCFEEGVVVLAKRGLLNIGGAQGREALGALLARDGREGRRAPLKLDMVTEGDFAGLPVALTDGYTDEEARCDRQLRETGNGHSGAYLKSSRERSFPVEIIETALAIDIRGAQASIPVDKTRILNSLAGRSGNALDGEVEACHDAWTAVNHSLRSTFALTVWPKVVAGGKSVSSPTGGGGLKPGLALEEAVASDVTRTQLSLNLNGMSHLRDLRTVQLGAVARALEPLVGLEQIELSMEELPRAAEEAEAGGGGDSGGGGETLADLWRSLGRLQALQRLALTVSHNAAATLQLDLLGAGLRELRGLKTLCLHADICRDLTQLVWLAEPLSTMLGLEELELGLVGTGLESVDELAESLAQLGQLRRCMIRLNTCDRLTGVGALGTKLPQSLEAVRLHIDFTRKAIDEEGITQLCHGLTALASLESLELLARRGEVGDLAGLGRALKDFRSTARLRSLRLAFSLGYTGGCTLAPDIGEGLTGLVALRELDLNLEDSEQLQSVGGLFDGLANIAALESLTLSFKGCKRMEGLGNLGASVALLARLERFELHVVFCKRLRLEALKELSQGLQSQSRAGHEEGCSAVGLRLRVEAYGAAALPSDLQRSFDGLDDFVRLVDAAEPRGADDDGSEHDAHQGLGGLGTDDFWSSLGVPFGGSGGSSPVSQE